jgi:hypothetical protein
VIGFFVNDATGRAKLGVSVTAFKVGAGELPEFAPPAPRGRPRKSADGEGPAGKSKDQRKGQENR